MTPTSISARWRVLTLYALLNALMQFQWLRFAPIANDVAAQYGVSVGTVGWLSLVFPLLFLPLALPSGAWVDRLSLRSGLRLVAGVLLAGALLRELWPGFAGLLAGQILIALVQPMLMSSLAPLARVWFEPEQRLQATAVGTLALFVGLGAAFVLIPLSAGDVAASQSIDTIVLAIVAALVFALVPRDPPAPIGDTMAAPSGKSSARFLLTQPALLLLFALIFIGNGFFNALFTWIEPMLGANGLNADAAGYVALAMLAGGVAGMVFVPALPVLAARLRLTLSLAAALGIPLTLMLTRSNELPLLCAIGVVLGVTMLAPLPLLLDTVSELAGDHHGGLAMSAFWLAGNAGAAAVIYALSYLADHQLWSLAGYAFAGLLLLQLLLVQALRVEPFKAEADRPRCQ
ncbi:MAG: transporter [Hydrocarboniphaga sp.]|uniref:MFS transporter n=1 Tax=Hydrocarboniphaga sp. TaxID=2033016 RepID=UPI00261F2E54|nr:MFS transporter [Hydrocarboniphaga sp.]MDB5971045.1 transporter [Hydrocarboniphaga sp.]